MAESAKDNEPEVEQQADEQDSGGEEAAGAMPPRDVAGGTSELVSEGDESDVPPPDLAEQLAAATALAAEHWEKLLRMQAEMDNLRKRNGREIDNARKFALERIAMELLAVRDSLENAIKAGQEEDAGVAGLREGNELILRQLTQAMEKFHIVAVDPDGEKFNPDLHQAMSMQEHPDTEPNTVVAVMQKGYLLNERLLRPALVMVAK